MLLEKTPPPDDRVALLATPKQLCGGLEVGVITAQRLGDSLRVRATVVHRRLLDGEDVQAVKIGQRADRGQDRLQPQAEQDVPGADSHRFIVPAILPAMDGVAPFGKLDFLYTPSGDVA